MSPWQEHCEGKKDLESFVRNVEEFAESLYTIIADRAGKRIHISFTDVVSCLVWHVLLVIHCISSTVSSLCSDIVLLLVALHILYIGTNCTHCTACRRGCA